MGQRGHMQLSSPPTQPRRRTVGLVMTTAGSGSCRPHGRAAAALPQSFANAQRVSECGRFLSSESVAFRRDCIGDQAIAADPRARRARVRELYFASPLTTPALTFRGRSWGNRPQEVTGP